MSNTLVGLLVRHKRDLVLVVLLGVAALFGNFKYLQFQLQAKQIDTLYNEVLSKLQRQARLARNSSQLPAYIGSIQLRDLILNESNLAHKMRLWDAVSRKVDRNTNVKHSLLEIHGEVMKVWQWISNIE